MSARSRAVRLRELRGSAALTGPVVRDAGAARAAVPRAASRRAQARVLPRGIPVLRRLSRAPDHLRRRPAAASVLPRHRGARRARKVEGAFQPLHSAGGADRLRVSGLGDEPAAPGRRRGHRRGDRGALSRGLPGRTPVVRLSADRSRAPFLTAVPGESEARKNSRLTVRRENPLLQVSAAGR